MFDRLGVKSDGLNQTIIFPVFGSEGNVKRFTIISLNRRAFSRRLHLSGWNRANGHWLLVSRYRRQPS